MAGADTGNDLAAGEGGAVDHVLRERSVTRPGSVWPTVSGVALWTTSYFSLQATHPADVGSPKSGQTRL